MGGNIETGMMDMLDNEQKREMFSEHFHKVLDKEIPGEQHAEERERRHDEGPPIFREGEIIELRGGRFRVARIDARKLILRPLKG